MAGRHFNFSLFKALCAMCAMALLSSCTLEMSIKDMDPTPTLTAGNITITEGGSGILTLTLNKPAPRPVVFSYVTQSGTATDPDDFTAMFGVVTINQGWSGATLNIGSVQDSWYEGQEFYTVRFGVISEVILSSSLSAGITVYINDDENVPKVFIADASSTEGSALEFLITLDVASQAPVSFNYQSFDGSAFVAKSDYAAGLGRLTLSSGVMGITLSVNSLQDVLSEYTESFSVTLSGLTGVEAGDISAQGDIVDDDPMPELRVYDLALSEGDNAGLVVSLSALSGRDVVFGIITSDNTAVQPLDYIGISKSVTIPEGSISHTEMFVSVEDLLNEGDETVDVTLSPVVNAQAGDYHGVITIQDDDLPPNLFISDASVVEGGTLSFVVSLSVVSGLPVTVSYQSYNGTATTADLDYTSLSGQITIPALTGSITLQVATGDDLKFEIDEQLTVSLSAPVNAGLGDGSGVGTIQNDDIEPVLSVADLVFNEGETAQFVATLSALSGVDVVFTWSTVNGSDADPLNNAAAPNDFTAVSSVVVTIPVGATFVNLQVTSVDDAIDEFLESFTLTLTGVTGATPTSTGALGSITDNDATPTLSIDDIIIAEGLSGSFTVTLSAVSGLPVSFSYRTYDGSNGAVTLNAQEPDDYNALALTTVTIPAGSLSLMIEVVSNDDAYDEADYEDFNVSLSSAVNATFADALGLGQISDDEGPPQLFISDLSDTEGGAKTLLISMSGLSSNNVIFDYDSYDGTATAGELDYTAISGRLTIPSGSLTTSVSIATLDDALDEDDETLTVSLSNLQYAIVGDIEGVLTLLDNDDLPDLFISDSTVTEGTSLNFSVSLSVVSGREVIVDRMSYAGSALAPQDFTSLALTSITIPRGVLSIPVLVETIDDSINENQESMTVSLSSPVNANLVDALGTGTINDNDPDPSIFVTDSTVTEGTSLAFLITLNTLSEVDVVFDAATYDNTATSPDDFIATALTDITIPAGSLSVTLYIETIDDPIDEVTETMTLSLASVQDAAAGDFLGLGTINDNDDPPGLFVADASAVTEGETAYFTVSLQATSGLDVTFSYTTVDDTAVDTQDYSLTSGTGTITAGNLSTVIAVVTSDDLVDEVSPEYFTLSISAPTAAVITDGDGQGTINDNDNPPQIFIADASGLEGETLEFVVTLSSVSDLNVDFVYSTINGTAMDPSDFAEVSIASQIPAGMTAITLSLGTIEDDMYETDETLTLTLSSLVNVNAGDVSAQGTIQNDDPLPTLFITSATITEGETATLWVTLSNPNQADVSFDIQTQDNSALSTTDYVAWSLTRLTIPGGALSISLDVASVEDLINEPTEDFTVEVSNPSGAVGTPIGTITINDDDTPPELFVVDAAAVTEGETSIFLVTLSKASGLDVTFNFTTVDGTAVDTQDYVAGSGLLTIAPGLLAIIIPVVTVDDDRDEEPTESYTLSISGATNASISDDVGSGTINDNDNPPLIFVVDGSFDESLDSSVVVTISSLSDREITFSATSFNGSAVAPGDYTSVSNLSGTIPAGSLSFTYTIVVDDDTVYELDETYTVSLSNLVNTTAGDDLATITIENNDAAPTLAIYDLSIPEGETGSFIASLSALSEVPVIFTWETLDQTAVSAASEDFTAQSAVQVTIPALTASTLLDVITSEDLLNEGDETFLVSLSALTGATFSDDVATGTISDDDGPPEISIYDVAVTEGGDLEFLVSLSAVSGLAITVNYQSYNGTALVSDSDYTGISGQLTIPALMGQMTLAVSTGNDTKYEIDETMTVSLASPVNATILDGIATGTIENDDIVPVLSVADVVVTEGDTANFIATLSAVSGVDVVFNWASIDGTALKPDDYTEVTSTQVTISVGQTFILLPVDTIDDALDESSEAFTITLTSITGASPVATGAEATLNDNDDPPTLAIDDIIIAEGDSGFFTVTLSAVSGLDVEFSYRTYDGSNGAVTLNAVAPGDYDAISLTAVTIPAGQSSFTISVNTQDDALDEADYEDFNVSLSAASNATILDALGLAQISDDEGPPQIFIGDFTSDEGGSEVLAITLSGLSGVDVIFNYQTYDGTATSGENDYTAKSGQITIPSGSLTTSVSIASNDDSLDEDDETFIVSLSSVVNAIVGDDVGLVTLLDNDNLPELYISDSSVTEGVSLSFTVSLNVISGRDVTVQRMTYDGSAAAPGDYTGLVLSTITISKGDLFTYVYVETIDDSVNENQETMLVSLSSAVNATVSQETGPGTISDNDPDPMIYVTDSTVTEGTSLEFVITLNVASEVDVVFDAQTYEGTALDPEDFIATALSNITIPAGSISYSVWVETIDDLINEFSEVMTLSLANVQDATSGDFVGSGQIDDNDPQPALYISDASAVTEGQSAIFVVTLSAVSGLDVEFSFTTVDDTAVSTQDYATFASTVTIPAGSLSHTIQVATADDLRDEVSSEYFDVTITAYTNANPGRLNGTGEIQDNDSAPFIFISDASELEGDTLYFTVTISALSDLNVDFIAQSFDGTADGADYSAISLASQIPAGSLGITISVNSTEDEIYETDETFTVSLLSIVNASVQTPGDESGTGTIQNDEVLPQIFISDATINEGETASLSVTISGLNQADVIFTYETVDDSALAASDYTAHALATITIPGGSLSHTINVISTEDLVYEVTEQFFVNVSAGSGATGTPQGTVTINDDDGMPEIFVSDASAVTEGQTSEFVITLSALTSFDVSFTYQTYDGTAISTQDYTAVTGTATIPANT